MLSDLGSVVSTNHTNTLFVFESALNSSLFSPGPFFYGFPCGGPGLGLF